MAKKCWKVCHYVLGVGIDHPENPPNRYTPFFEWDQIDEIIAELSKARDEHAKAEAKRARDKELDERFGQWADCVRFLEANGWEPCNKNPMVYRSDRSEVTFVRDGSVATISLKPHGFGHGKRPFVTVTTYATPGSFEYDFREAKDTLHKIVQTMGVSIA